MLQNIAKYCCYIVASGKFWKKVELISGRKLKLTELRIIFVHLALVDGMGHIGGGKNVHRILRRNPEERPHRSPRSIFCGVECGEY